MNDQPSLPYDGTEGWSGSETSKQRAYREASDGVASVRQRLVLDLLSNCGPSGATWFEVANAFNLHHGQASGSLTSLHKAGRIERLTEVRGRSQIYVLPAYINGREIAPYKPNRSLKDLNRSLKDLVDRINELEEEKRVLLNWIDDLENEVEDLKGET